MPKPSKNTRAATPSRKRTAGGNGTKKASSAAAEVIIPILEKAAGMRAKG